MKKYCFIGLLCAFVLSGCSNHVDTSTPVESVNKIEAPEIEKVEEKVEEIVEEIELKEGINEIILSDDEVTLNGVVLDQNIEQSVYVANDIVYYEEGKGLTYGKGTMLDEHSAEEAGEHKVLHINHSGTFKVSGKLTKGQIAIDLGKESKNNPKAVVNLILDNVDINCEVAPAILFYNVFEAFPKQAVNSKTLDTSFAGANIVIADDSINNISGSYVARIYKPGSVVLGENGQVIEEKKLHKYDGAIHSRRTLNINTGEKGNGVLNINAKNEGLDSEMHLTINGGVINIRSFNDCINANEDGISVITINDGDITVRAVGEVGDAIDSNGDIVINGGNLLLQACKNIETDSALSSRYSITKNGGSVIASSNNFEGVDNCDYMGLYFEEQQKGGIYSLIDANGQKITEFEVVPNFTNLLFSIDGLESGEYVLKYNGEDLYKFRYTKGKSFYEFIE